MDLATTGVDQLRNLYHTKKKEIFSRLREFEKIWSSGSDEEIFAELAFCLMTPQSKAKSCWEALVTIKGEDLLFKGSADEIRKKLHCVRFHNKKAQYLEDARALFVVDGRISVRYLLENFSDVYECREWLVKNVRGLGYKEASHFLRNIGLGEKIAILDRHILRNLVLLGVVEEMPESLSRSKYLQIEKELLEFSKHIGIPPAHLDLLLWYKETGEIFK